MKAEAMNRWCIRLATRWLSGLLWLALLTSSAHASCETTVAELELLDKSELGTELCQTRYRADVVACPAVQLIIKALNDCGDYAHCDRHRLVGVPKAREDQEE